MPASALHVAVIKNFTTIQRLQITAVASVVAMKIFQLGRRKGDRLRKYMPLRILSQRRCGQRTEIVEITQVCRQQRTDVKLRHRLRLPCAYDASHDGVKCRIGGAFLKRDADHGKATVFGAVDQMQFQWISLAVKYMLARCVEVELLQLKAAAANAGEISRQYVDLYRV